MQVNTLILGAGAAGLMCAAHAGPGALVIDHARARGDRPEARAALLRVRGEPTSVLFQAACVPDGWLGEWDKQTVPFPAVLAAVVAVQVAIIGAFVAFVLDTPL